MTETSLKEDPLSRIQREIIEVTEREREFKEGHFRMNRLLSESTVDVARQNGHVNGDAPDKPERALSRALSTSQLLGPVAPASPPTAHTLLHTNGYTRRFTPQTGTKGIMQRFIASKGKISVGSSPVSPTSPVGLAPQPILSPAALAPAVLAPAAITRTPEGKPVRKGYVPVEEKIQKELQEMKDREHELKKMRRRQKPFDIELSENETSSESEEDESAAPGPLRAARSIGELCAALVDEARSPSPRVGSGSGHDSLGSLKPAKSLAELCELGPGQEFLAPSSTRLIAQWESIIQQKQEAGAA